MSIKSTLIARVSDGLPLSASVDEQEDASLTEYKSQAKLIIRRLNSQSEDKCSIDSGNGVIHYLISEGIVYLLISSKSYPRKLSFSYLDELSKEFARSYGSEPLRVTRPYAFVKFDTFIQRTKKLYEDSRTSTAAKSNLDTLNEELNEISNIMSKNIQDILYRGDSLDKMSSLSSSLRDESLKYRKHAKDINFHAWLRKWAPVAFFGFFFFVFILYRFW
ncbi:snare-like protein [Atractiella rhizophila]|nr:snare-like protein [Atractiella rhizophila]